MIEVISVRFKDHGKSYFFSPNGITAKIGDPLIVETVKGLELAECCIGNHPVEDTSVILPLRPVVRIATEEDLKVAEANHEKEAEAFKICEQKIIEHELDMKLVDVECNFEGNKTTFFFTSDGRVDFRELVKDLASIFRNRIELRQIGVRDEAKMLGGLGICGRPYCCHQFLESFEPVSTKMAKVQNLSLNPTKISGSCGRLMCCLRYEQSAYEDLVIRVPKLGAYVETPNGYGTVTQVNLLRQIVKVKLDEDDDSTIKSFTAKEVATVPGGKPKDGETPASVLKEKMEADEYDDEEVEADNLSSQVTSWNAPIMFAEDADTTVEEIEEELEELDEAEGIETEHTQKKNSRNRRNNRYRRKPNNQQKNNNASKENSQTNTASAENSQESSKQNTNKKPYNKHKYYHHNKKPKNNSGNKGPSNS